VWGYLNLKGHVAIEPTFEWAGSFVDGLGRVKLNGKWGMVDASGRFVIKPDLDVIEPIVDKHGWADRYYKVERDGLYGFIKSDGQWLLKPQYDGVSRFGDEWVGVKKNDEYFFVDSEGMCRLRMTDTEVPHGIPYHGFCHGLAAIRVGDNTFVWVDQRGKVQIEPRRAFLPFHFTDNGVCVVWVEGGAGARVSALMDTDGKYVFGPARGRISPFPLYSGLNRVVVGKGTMRLETYIRPNGEVLWIPKGYRWPDAEQ
jgi:hypothetical protein